MSCIYCTDNVLSGGVTIKSLFCIPGWVVAILAVLFGTATALLWNFGFIQFVRAMIPFGLGIGVIVFAITALLKARCGNTAEVILTSTCSSLRRYSPFIMIAALIFLVFAIVVLATFLPFTVRLVLAYIGSISFFTMLFEFVAMVLCMWFRR